MSDVVIPPEVRAKLLELSGVIASVSSKATVEIDWSRPPEELNRVVFEYIKQVEEDNATVLRLMSECVACLTLLL